jgi:chaperonin cofactor prefoldin
VKDDLIATVREALAAPWSPDCNISNLLIPDDCHTCALYANAPTWLAELADRLESAHVVIAAHEERTTELRERVERAEAALSDPLGDRSLLARAEAAEARVRELEERIEELQTVLDYSIPEAAATERARIVAWLRSVAVDPVDQPEYLADAIEAGAHHSEDDA